MNNFIDLYGLLILIQILLGITLTIKVRKYLISKSKYIEFYKETKDLEGQKIIHQVNVDKFNKHASELNDYAKKLDEKIKEFNNMHNNVYYDKENNTIVIFNNLEELGLF